MVLAFSVLWLTIFISWTLYYVIMMLRQANQLVGSFKEKVEKIGQAVERIRDKFDHTSAYIGLVGKAVEKLIDFVGERKKKSKR